MLSLSLRYVLSLSSRSDEGVGFEDVRVVGGRVRGKLETGVARLGCWYVRRRHLSSSLEEARAVALGEA